MFLRVEMGGRYTIEPFGNRRFSNARRLTAFLHGETFVSPTPFIVRFPHSNMA